MHNEKPTNIRYQYTKCSVLDDLASGVCAALSCGNEREKKYSYKELKGSLRKLYNENSP
jgi:hypothetical protein